MRVIILKVYKEIFRNGYNDAGDSGYDNYDEEKYTEFIKYSDGCFYKNPEIILPILYLKHGVRDLFLCI